MADIILRPAAAADLDDIAGYTIERWGRKQAGTYLATLRLDILSLSEFPERHPRHPSRYGEFRKMSSGHHLIFYLYTGNQIDIVRVVHERMDFDGTLD